MNESEQLSKEMRILFKKVEGLNRKLRSLSKKIQDVYGDIIEKKEVDRELSKKIELIVNIKFIYQNYSKSVKKPVCLEEIESHAKSCLEKFNFPSVPNSHPEMMYNSAKRVLEGLKKIPLDIREIDF